MSLPTNNEVLRELEAAAKSGDDRVIGAAMLHAFQTGLSCEFVPALVDILVQPSHRSHEDIVLALQELKDARAVDAIYDAALVQHDYLAYDEFSGLARKCTWALADIGTPEARTRLEMLAQHRSSQIAGYAKKRLERWNDERHRKGA
ncbi:MAG: hypothetical protein JWR26_4079 [Pedosphaera sp.]|nr:hypothetical protein [Pedosphaera sp.]